MYGPTDSAGKETRLIGPNKNTTRAIQNGWHEKSRAWNLRLCCGSRIHHRPPRLLELARFPQRRPFESLSLANRQTPLDELVPVALGVVAGVVLAGVVGVVAAC